MKILILPATEKGTKKYVIRILGDNYIIPQQWGKYLISNMNIKPEERNLISVDVDDNIAREIVRVFRKAYHLWCSRFGVYVNEFFNVIGEATRRALLGKIKDAELLIQLAENANFLEFIKTAFKKNPEVFLKSASGEDLKRLIDVFNKDVAICVVRFKSFPEFMREIIFINDIGRRAFIPFPEIGIREDYVLPLIRFLMNLSDEINYRIIITPDVKNFAKLGLLIKQIPDVEKRNIAVLITIAMLGTIHVWAYADRIVNIAMKKRSLRDALLKIMSVSRRVYSKVAEYSAEVDKRARAIFLASTFLDLVERDLDSKDVVDIIL